MDSLFLDRYKQTIRQNTIYGEQKRRSSSEKKAVYAFVYPDYSKVWGIDISPWDGNVNLQTTKDYGASFVFIKGMDGTIPSRYFPENRQRAIEAGLLHAPYAWLYRDANVSCVSQARAYSELIKKYPSDLPPVIDFEWTTWQGKSSNPTYTDLDKWVTEFLKLGNRKPILYTAAGFADAYGRIPVDLKEKFTGLWAANFGVEKPLIPLGFSTYLLHQFTDLGGALTLAPGDKNKLELDLNYWNGSRKGLFDLANQKQEPEPTTPPIKKRRIIIEGDFTITEI